MDSAPEREELELLFEISRIFNKHVDIRSALGPVLSLLETQAGLKNGVVALLDKSSGMLKVEEASGSAPKEKAGGFFRLGEDHAGRVFETGMPLTVPDASGLTFFCVPICSGAAVIGTLSAERGTMNEKHKFCLARSGHKQVLRFLEKVSSIVADSLRIRERIAEEQDARRRPELSGGAEKAASLETALAGLEKELIVDALKNSGGNMAAASRRLGITERQMGLRVGYYGINRKIYGKR